MTGEGGVGADLGDIGRAAIVAEEDDERFLLQACLLYTFDAGHNLKLCELGFLPRLALINKILIFDF